MLLAPPAKEVEDISCLIKQLRRSKRRATEAGRVAEEEWSDEEDQLRSLLQATTDLAVRMVRQGVAYHIDL